MPLQLSSTGIPLKACIVFDNLYLRLKVFYYTDSAGYILAEDLCLGILPPEDCLLIQCWSRGSCDSCLDSPVNNNYSISCGWCPYVSNLPPPFRFNLAASLLPYIVTPLTNILC